MHLRSHVHPNWRHTHFIHQFCDLPHRLPARHKAWYLKLPVFSAYSGGLAKLAGPTGGYLIGFIFMSIISGIFIKQGKGKILPSILGMAIGTAVAYLFGTIWFMIESGSTLMYALTACVFPFLIGDAVKILLASNIGPLIRSALQKAHLLESL